MIPKLVLFDIGGVLIEYSQVFKSVSAAQNIPIQFINEKFKEFKREITTGVMGPQEFYLKNFNGDPGYDFLESWASDYRQVPSAHNVLNRVASKYDVGILSNIYRGMVPKIFKKGLIPQIDYRYIFLSCELGCKKPEREIYDHVINTVNLEPQEVLLIDDKERNLLPAQELGWQTFHFNKLDPDFSSIKISELLLRD